MKTLKSILVIVVILLTIINTQAQQKEFPKITGPYLGQKPPGKTPEKFPFDYMIEGYKLHSAPIFTPEGKELYFSAMNFSIRYSERIFVMKMIDSFWTPPRVASFSGDYFDGSPSMSRDGKYLFFSSARKLDGSGMNETGERYLWYVERKGNGWSLPKPFNRQLPVLGNGSDISELGNYFFDSRGDIVKVKFTPDKYDTSEKLETSINSNATELHPCIASDERFIVFYSSRTGHYGSGGGDLYISFKNKVGKWKQAVNMGKRFNEGHLSTSFPRLSPDGKYFFFTSYRNSGGIPLQESLTFQSIKTMQLQTGNGGGDIYWISADIVEELRPEE